VDNLCITPVCLKADGCYTFCVEHHAKCTNANGLSFTNNKYFNMWTISSTTDVLTDVFTDVGVVLAFVIGAILSAVVALLGLGYGFRLVKRYITGKKF